MNDIQHIIPNQNIMIQNDRTTVYTMNTRNIHADLQFNVHTSLPITNLTKMFHIDEQYLCPTTKERIFHAKSYLSANQKGQKVCIQTEHYHYVILRHHPIALGAYCSCI